MNKMRLDGLIFSNCVKYFPLTNMINEAYVGSTSNTIDIYVDVYSITKALYSNMNIELGEYNNLVSCLVNLGIHYKYFFMNRYNVRARVYFIYSTNTPYINNQFVKDYNKSYLNSYYSKKIITKYIRDNIDNMKMIIDYLPDLYLIETTFEVGVVIYDLMCRQDVNNENGHCIITRDPYNFQLVNMKPNTILIRTKTSDTSYYINKNTVLQGFFNERKVKKTSQIISPDLLTTLLALTSVKERNIKMLFNVTKAVNMLEHAITEHKILNGYNSDLEYLWNNIYDQDFKVGFSTFEFRFKAIDIQFQHSVFITTPECLEIEKRLIDKFDPEGIKAINNEYFKTNPLDLNRL